jgi:hypothetical protein
MEKSFRVKVAPLAKEIPTPLNLRMGIASGGVVYSDNFQEETTGEGVTVTQRIARLGGGPHGGNILVSANVAADAMKSPAWSERLFDLGFCDAGDGMRIHLYNLQGFGYGSVTLPPGLSPKAPALPPAATTLEPIKATPLPLSRGARNALVVSLLLAVLGTAGWQNQKSLAKISASVRKTYHDWVTPKPSRSKASRPARNKTSKKNPTPPKSARALPAAPSTGVNERVLVPKLTGVSHDAALRLLQYTELAAADADTAYSPSVPEGIVFRQQPAAGTRVPPGTIVSLVVSLGPDLSDTPDTAVGSDDADSPASPPDTGETPAEDAGQQ